MSPPVSRRDVLTAFPPLLSLSGCLSDSSSDSTPETDTVTSSSSTPTQTPTPDLRGDRPPMERASDIPERPDGPVTEVSVSSDVTGTEGPHPADPTVEIWNMGPKRELSVVVRSAGTGTHLDRTTTFARGESLVISFDGENRYLVALGVDGGTEYGTVIGRDRFFCNDSTTFVYVRPDEVVETITSTTELQCLTPTDDA